jgi:chlorobactene glucosyltransferase
MLYQIIITIILIALAVNIVFNLRSLKKPDKKIKPITSPPMVSVLIPARNEEQNIKQCVESLLNQNYENYEIIVLDDNSSDNTGEIVAELARKDNRLTLIKGEQLPPDWAGKPFACYQLAKKSKGDWLLFVDADTFSEPEMLKSTMQIALESKPALLSGFPRQITRGFAQTVVIPIIYFIMLWVPLWWLKQLSKPKPSLALGQFLMFPRDKYWAIGGHSAVKSRIIEDVWLSYEITKQGGRHLTIDLTSVFSCNMYNDIGSMWEGFKKWMYSVSILSPLVLILLLISAYILFLSPFVFLWYELFMTPSPVSWLYLLIFQVILVIFMRIIVDNHFKASLVSSILHPLGLAYVIASVIYTFIEQLMGKGVKWKDRCYSHKSNVK